MCCDEKIFSYSYHFVVDYLPKTACPEQFLAICLRLQFELESAKEVSCGSHLCYSS